jgi:large subunit ribosomal protein L23|tara:strand:- start:51 stop:368 length:318 start_codon:yes stop_codon:yes gene_type:complete
MSIKSSIILRPILSEKGTMLSEALNKYVFQVEKQCNKLEIKDVIEEKFKVKVKKVATMNFKGKNKSMTIKSSGHTLRTRGNRSSWKKAIVTLEKGFSINLLGGEE